MDDVVVPVGFEDFSVGGEVTLGGGESVGDIENGEKIGQQVDQHSPRARGGRERRGDSEAEG